MSTVAQPPVSQKPRAWHAVDAEAAASALGSGAGGLTSGQAHDRLANLGPNAPTRERETTRLDMLINQFRSPLILLLLAAALIMLVIGEWLDSLVILLVVVVNAAIGYLQESHAAQSVRALRALLSDTARVLRDEHEFVVDSEEIVPGDVVLLDSGTRIPADMRIVAATSLLVDESLLTGESESVHKHPEPIADDTELADRTNMVFAGTTVIRGRGRGLVVGTGDATELGVIAEEMREVERRATPLQRQLDRMARVVGIIVVISAAIAFVAGILAGRSTSEMFLVAVAVAVSAVPEGLPIAFTITLAVGVRHMARRNAIVRRLPVVETLGSTTIIGSDKTGTLTENRMAVQRIWSAGEDWPIPESGLTQNPEIRPARGLLGLTPVEMTALCGAMTNEASVFFDGEEWGLTGDPTETALLVSAMSVGIDVNGTRTEMPLDLDIPFEPDRGFSASLRQFDRHRVLFVKGAPEGILAASGDMLCHDGIRPIDRDQIIHASRSIAARGERVLGMAYRLAIGHHEGFDPDVPPANLTFLGLQAMSDPARHGAADAIETCHAAGVRTIMITGDHQATASAISRQLGITDESGIVFTGSELAALPSAEFDRAIQKGDVFARVTPEQKLEIVHALQRAGEVVAVTGDGVNDAPALRASDIGVAMGKRGTDVAKEAADMVLADDNFVSIVAAIEVGRTTYDNVRKVVSFLFTTNAAEVLIIVAALLLDWPLPMIAVQILWLNLVTDSLQVMALAFEPSEPDVMSRPPLGRSAGILTRALWQRVGLSGVVMTVGTLALFKWELDRGTDEQTAQTMALTTMVLFQMFQALNSRSEKRSLFRMNPLGNRFLLIAVATSLLVHTGALYLPATQYLLRVEPLTPAQWGMALAVSSTIVLAVELHKAAIRRRN